MKLSRRAYPYPVVGNGDDVNDAFQAAIEVSKDGMNYFVHISLVCASPTINRLIQKGEAAYVLHVECGNTLYRQTFEFTKSETEHMIPGECLNASVELNVFARSKKEINRYKVTNSHPDYADLTFSVSSGDVLAVAEGQCFDADIDYDSLKYIDSIMEIRGRVTESQDGPMTVELTRDKIRIELCKSDYENFRLMRSQPQLANTLVSSIVLPALVEALRDMQTNLSSSELRWCRCLKRRLEVLGIHVNDDDALTPAQELLELPLRRAFANAKSILEAIE